MLTQVKIKNENISKDIPLNELEIGQYGVVSKWSDEANKGMLICRCYHPKNEIVQIVCIKDPSSTWTSDCWSKDQFRVVPVKQINISYTL